MNIRTSLQTAGILSFIAVFTKLFGFAKNLFVASYFGANPTTDGFFLAMLAPEFMDYFITIGLPIVAIPVIVDYITSQKVSEVWRIVSSLLNLTLIFAFFLLVIGQILVAPLFSLFLPVDNSVQTAEIIKIVRIILPTVILIGIFGIMLGVMNAFKRFIWPSSVQLIGNLIIIGSIVLLAHTAGIYGLVLGVIFAAFTKSCLLTPSLRKVGFKYSLVVDMQSTGLRKMGRLLLPILGVMFASRANYLLGRLLAAGFADGSVSFLTYASKLTEMPLTFFVVSLSTVLLPKFSYDVAQGESKELTNALHTSINVLFLFIVPSQLFLAFYRTPLIRFFFQRGAFSASATAPTASAMLCYSVGLFTWCLIEPIKRVYYARKNTKVPSSVAAVSMVLSLSLSLLLMHTKLRHAGIALANSLGSIFYMVALTYIYRKQTKEIKIWEIIFYMTRITIAGLTAILSSRWLVHFIGVTSPFAFLSVATCGFIPTYFALLKVFKFVLISNRK